MKNKEKILQAKRIKRIHRSRAKVFGTEKRPRLAATKTNYGFLLQLVDDNRGATLVAASHKDLGVKFKGTKTEAAHKLGELLAQKIQAQGIKQVVLDRRGRKFHGRLKALVEGLKSKGLKI